MNAGEKVGLWNGNVDMFCIKYFECWYTKGRGESRKGRVTHWNLEDLNQSKCSLCRRGLLSMASLAEAVVELSWIRVQWTWWRKNSINLEIPASNMKLGFWGAGQAGVIFFCPTTFHQSMRPSGSPICWPNIHAHFKFIMVPIIFPSSLFCGDKKTMDGGPGQILSLNGEAPVPSSSTKPLTLRKAASLRRRGLWVMSSPPPGYFRKTSFFLQIFTYTLTPSKPRIRPRRLHKLRGQLRTRFFFFFFLYLLCFWAQFIHCI